MQDRNTLLTIVVWIGKGLGCILFEPFVGVLGYKKLMMLIICIQIIGVVGEYPQPDIVDPSVELCAKSWVVFSVGRVIAYLAVGLIENACPAYEAEVTPAPLRGFVAGSLILLVRHIGRCNAC